MNILPLLLQFLARRQPPSVTRRFFVSVFACLLLVTGVLYNNRNSLLLAQTGNPTVVVTGGGNVSGYANAPNSSVSFSGSVTGAPTQGAECTLTGTGTPGPWSGPSWSWGAGVQGASGGLSVSVSPASGSSSVSVIVAYGTNPTPGTYTVRVTGTVSYSSNCGSKSGSHYKDFTVTVLAKDWSPDTGIVVSAVSPGTQGHYYIVENGSSVGLSLTASDSDKWTLGSTSGTEGDTLTYSWSGGTGGSFSSATSASTNWTPPTLPAGATSADFTVSCRVDDTPKAKGPGETGSRDDTSSTQSRLIRVVRKVWEADTPISGGDLTVAGGTTLVVEEGAQVGASVSPATDNDKWTKGGASGNTTGTEADDITYTWSAAFGSLSATDGRSTTWTAPDLPEGTKQATYTFKCRIDDTPKAIASNESGSRDDTPVDREVAVKVIQKVWDVGEPISGGGTFTVNGSATGNLIEVDPGSNLSITVSAATDTDHWVKDGEENTEADTLTYTWTSSAGGGSSGQSINYTAGQLPAGIDSVMVTLTCTVDDTPTPITGKDSGTRDDASKSASIIIKTVRKVWSPGQGIQGGVLTSPSTVTLAPGEHTGVAVSTATDIDSWAKGSQSGTEADSITYHWSGSGTFDNPNAAGTNWTPPTLPAGVTTRDYTLTCTINDKPTPIAAGEGGSRDDASKTATVTVTVNAGPGDYGSALLKVLSQGEANTTDPNKPSIPYITAENPVKGQIYVALDINSSGVNESAVTVRLREDAVTLGSESHVDVPINLASATGWQKFYDPDENAPGGNGPKQEAWWDAPEAPQGHAGHYRYLIPWNTVSPITAQRITFNPTTNNPNPDGVMVPGKLWNRNGDHTVSISSVANKAGDTLHFGIGANCVVQSKSVNVANLQKISKIQYRLGNGDWTDVPQVGEASYPLTVPRGSLVDFKAIRLMPQLGWPAEQPVWSFDGYTEVFSETSEYFGEITTGTNFKEISVSCNNTITSHVKVVAPSDNGQRIEKIQYSLDEGLTWADVPQPGAPTYPLTIDQGQYVDFKAVKSDPLLPWPSGQPYWVGFVDNVDGDTAWAWFTEFSEDNNDLAVVSVECGNTVSAYIKINRYYEIYLNSEKSSVLAGGVNSDPSKSGITATVFDWDYNPISGINVSLASTYEDGSTAGSIQGSVVTNQDGEAFATLLSGAKIAYATIKATATMPGGKTINDEVLVNFESLEAQVNFGDWQPATNGQQCTVNASLIYKGDSIVGRNVRLGITVTTDEEGLEPVSGFASQVTLSQPNGTTNNQGNFSTNILWQKSEAPQEYFVFVTVFDDAIVE